MRRCSIFTHDDVYRCGHPFSIERDEDGIRSAARAELMTQTLCPDCQRRADEEKEPGL